SSAKMDISKIKSLGYYPGALHFGSQSESEYFLIVDKSIVLCALNFSYCDFHGDIKFIVYNNESILPRLKEKYHNLSGSSFIYSKSSTYKPFKPSFNYNSANYFISYIHPDLFDESYNAYLTHIIYDSPLSPPFMDFTQSFDDSGSGDSGNPDTGDTPVTPPGSGSGGGTVTPPGGGSGGGTVTPPGGGSGGGTVKPPGGGSGSGDMDTP
ncbi:TPA: hypothetical protein ACIBS5_005548, partial [Salmonella enterica subsp. diarizonae serovar 60-67:z35:-]